MGVCLILADLMFIPDGIVNALKAVIALGLVIFVHELGHFLVAKLCGVKCEKFYVGFDVPIKLGPWRLPRSIVKFQRGETEYGVGIIPLGGYVKMLGQDDNPANAAAESERIKVQSGDEATDVNESSSDSKGRQLSQPPKLDPRSYPAKSVPQRMAIISAGVVMNVIFAVIFATVAYRMGVEFVPCVISATSPGYPAWEAGLQSGDKIIQIGKVGKENDQLRFDKDLKPKVITASQNNDLHFKIRRGDQKEWFSLQPLDQESGMKVIGVAPPWTATLGISPERLAKQFDPPFVGEITIMEIAGQAIEGDGNRLQSILAQHPDEVLSVRVARAPGEEIEGSDSSAESEWVDYQWSPLARRTIGIHMQISPVVAVQKNSPAADAGLLPEDRLHTIDGEPLGDPLVLNQRLNRLAGREVKIEVQRKNEKDEWASVELVVKPRLAKTLSLGSRPGEPHGVETLGIAFHVRNTVAAVEPGSPAEEAGVSAGDQIWSATFIPDNPREEEKELEIFQNHDPIAISETKPTWPFIVERMQLSQKDTRIKLTVVQDRNGEQITLEPVDSDEWFYAQRGIRPLILKRIRTAASWGEALQLGLRETGQGLMLVVKVLQRVTTGSIPLTSLGGPGTILYVAGMEASQGLATLLIFLTVLSANLAVVNFLPIPVLDGGHMLFLLVEGLRGKPLDEQLQMRISMFGGMIILSLMLFVIGLDLFHFLPWLF